MKAALAKKLRRRIQKLNAAVIVSWHPAGTLNLTRHFCRNEVPGPLNKSLRLSDLLVRLFSGGDFRLQRVAAPINARINTDFD